MSTFRLGAFTVNRLGYGAMQLTGAGVFGPPTNHDEAIAVLRAAVEAGVNHIDTAEYYGPTVVNELIREALFPYPRDLAIVSKVGASRDDRGGVSWPTTNHTTCVAVSRTTCRRFGSNASPRSTSG